jgi:hypothetical protein
MVSMTAGMLDHRNIGSNITLPLEHCTMSGALALVVQDGKMTEILFAHDDESITVDPSTLVEVSLPAAAAYTLHMKNAVEDLLAAIKGGPALRVVG